MIKLFKYISIFILVGWSSYAFSQDPQFSQFYAASTYLNPAFTGNTEAGRFAGTYRNQWPSIPGAFISYAFTYDHNMPDMNSGLGITAIHDKAGTGGLKFTNVGGLYSYYVRLDRKLFLRAGLKFSYTFRGIDESKLTFADQIIRDNAQETVENFSNTNTSYFDAGTGVLLYSNKFWFGVSLDHITQPEQSLVNGTAQLPIKSSVHGGYNIPLDETIKGDFESSVILSFNYKHQLNWNQLDLGGYYKQDAFIVGVWYRGIPFIKTTSISNNDAIVLMTGVETNKGLRIGYSYDITLSKIIGDTGGSHEISIVYEYPYKKRRKKKRSFVPCAKF